MGKVIADIAIIPMATEEVSVREPIVAAEKVLQRYTDLRSEINPMSTVLEGNLETVLEAAKAMHQASFAKGIKRVSTIIRIDDRQDGIQETMQERVQSVKEKLNV